MPIGIPRVGYRLPGDSSAQWVDLYNRLYRDRVLFLGADLDDELSNQIIVFWNIQPRIHRKQIIDLKLDL